MWGNVAVSRPHPIRRVRAWAARSRAARRILVTVASTLGGGGAGVGGLFLTRVRARVTALEDEPEYASAVSLNPFAVFHGRVSWPRLSWPRIPIWVWVCAVVLAVCAVLWLLARWPMRSPDNPFDRDPRRRFTSADRDWIRSCTQDRCEHRMLFGLLRCPRVGEQLDHHYPWSRGGATSRRNLVWLCARHNNRKSDRVPSRLSTWLLVRARARYWPVWARGDMVPDGMCETGDDGADDAGMGDAGDMDGMDDGDDGMWADDGA